MVKFSFSAGRGTVTGGLLLFTGTFGWILLSLLLVCFKLPLYLLSTVCFKSTPSHNNEDKEKDKTKRSISPMVLERALELALDEVHDCWFDFFALLILRVLNIKCILHMQDIAASGDDNILTKKEGGRSSGKKSQALALASLRSMLVQDKVLLLCNHRTRIDWLFFMVLFGMVGRNRSMHFVIKDTLAKCPIFGWCAQLFLCVFIARGRSVMDPNEIKKDAKPATQAPDGAEQIVRYLRFFERSLPSPYAMCIFPEGTDGSKRNFELHEEYAKSHGLPVCKYVLTPKSRGLIAILENMKNVSKENIVEVTMGYKDYVKDEKPNEFSLFLASRPPKEVHIFLKQGKGYLDDKEQPRPEMIKAALFAEYEEKEKLLTNFYEKGPPEGGVEINHHFPVFKTLVKVFGICVFIPCWFLYKLYGIIPAVLLILPFSFYIPTRINLSEMMLKSKE